MARLTQLSGGSFFVLLWVVLGCLTAIVLFFLLGPLYRARVVERQRAAFDAAVYRDQLDEVESDRERGLIGYKEAEAARIEIARRLLDADAREREGVADEHRVPNRGVMVAVAIALPLLALGFYLVYGSPKLPDQPLAARLEDNGNEQDIEVLVARVEARLREHPEEGEGWEAIAPVYMAWRRYADAAEAYGQAVRLLGETPKRLVGQGQALVLANDGIVTEPARGALEKALALDPEQVQARILLIIAKEQDGKLDEAIADWKALLNKAPADAAWRKSAEQRLADDEAKLKGGPTPEAVEAAKQMSPTDRQAMIESMVAGLAAKLEANGDDLAGWLKLVRAYSVLNKKDEAEQALAKARAKFSGNADALGQLDRLAAELGLKS
jgi:cytochrome c-type biogenesis protein CcmH